MESDTFVGDLEDDIDDYVFYSSDEEWNYEKKSSEEMDYFKRTKTIKKHKLTTIRDVMNKERQIMEEIIKKDIENANELDEELCEHLLQDKGANLIERAIEDSLFLTEIKETEASKPEVNTTEVIDIVKKDEADYVKSSLTMKCKCSNPQNIVFPWNIKLSNNWLEHGKLEDIKVRGKFQYCSGGA